MEKIVIATNNKGKIKEIKEILKKYEIVSLSEEGIDIEVEEDKDTFEGNAIKKATEIARLTGKTAIADDSGLCIDILNGFPGVKTARFLGEEAAQEQRNSYILEQMKEIPKEQRSAKSITCIALSTPSGQTQVFKGILDGYIASEKRGKCGFGYDEIFETKEGFTLAELDAISKNQISNRRMALNELKKYLENR